MKKLILQKLWKKAVFPVVCRIKIKVCATVASAINLQYRQEWLNRVLIKCTRANDVVVILIPVLNISEKVASTRRAFKVKSKGRLIARLVALGWKHGVYWLWNHVCICLYI